MPIERTRHEQPPEGGIFLPKSPPSLTDLAGLSEFYWEQYRDLLPAKAGNLLLGSILAENFPPGYPPGQETSRLCERTASVTFDARFYNLGEFAWEITLATPGSGRDEWYLSTSMCISSLSRYDQQGKRTGRRYLDAKEITSYTEWLGDLLTSQLGLAGLTQAVKAKRFPKAIPFNQPVKKQHKPGFESFQSLPIRPKSAPVDRDELPYKPEAAVNMTRVFKLLEGLDEKRRLSQMARATLYGLEPGTWRQLIKVVRELREGRPWKEIKPSEEGRLLVNVEQVKEQAYLYDDAVATIRHAGEVCAKLLQERLKPGIHTIEGNRYMVYKDLKRRTWFCKVDPKGTLVFFNRWDNIEPSEGRAASFYEYCELLVDTQFKAVYKESPFSST